MKRINRGPSGQQLQTIHREFLKELQKQLQGESYERGEHIDFIQETSLYFKQQTQANLSLGTAPVLKNVIWQLDSLYHEAVNMQNSPKRDLFLYLKAFHALKNNIKSILENVKAVAA